MHIEIINDLNFGGIVNLKQRFAMILLFLAGCSPHGQHLAGDTEAGSDSADSDSMIVGGDSVSDDTDPTNAMAFCDPGDTDPNGPVCVTAIASDTAFDTLSIGVSSIQHWNRATKYMVPVSDDSNLIPALFQNANRYAMHMDFLSATFMPGISQSEYEQLVMARDTRSYFTGNFIRINTEEQGTFYGFTVYTLTNAAEVLEPVEVYRIYKALQSIFTAGPLVFTFEPSDAVGPLKARAWVNPEFPIFFLNQSEVNAEVYTPGENFGWVRLYTLAEFTAASEAGLIGYRDLIVIDEVPFDVENVVAGVVTGGRQWELSHVNVRMARRGTPNLYVKDALNAFSAWEGQLVKLSAVNDSSATDSWTIAAAEEAEAATWWADHRPRLEDIPEVDAQYTALEALTQMDVSDSLIRLVSRVGGKASNLARLYAFLDEKYQVPGFAIPFAWFREFMDTNVIMDERNSPSDEVSLSTYVSRLAADAEVAGNAALRHQLLSGLREHMLTRCSVSPDLTAKLQTQIQLVFGSAEVKVKFRSSSNIEDGLEFSGAGLYESTGVCAADSMDADIVGPSLCDTDKDSEQTIERGLLTVWSGLYNNRAWDERDWYQVPQATAAMAVLVTRAFPDEAANGVAFTGNPSDAGDERYLINVQIGDEKVVSNDAHIVPELDMLSLTDGKVTRIHRIRSSVLATPGIPVLSDAQLEELGSLMAMIDEQYPLELGEHSREEVLLDIEFKIEKDTGQLIIKQIRPFLESSVEMQ